MGVNEPGMRLDMFLHLGTLAAIFLYYRRTVAEVVKGLRGKDSWLYLARIAASAVPAVAVYFCFKDNIAAFFENSIAVAAALIFTGLVLIATRFLPRGSRGIGFGRAVVMGCAQAVALLPGVSRSGMTLAAARACSAEPEKSAEFSFLMSAPLIAGGALIETLKAPPAGEMQVGWGLTIYGALLAAVAGYFSLAFLVRTLKGRRFWLFGPYCIVAGIVVLLV